MTLSLLLWILSEIPVEESLILKKSAYYKKSTENRKLKTEN